MAPEILLYLLLLIYCSVLVWLSLGFRSSKLFRYHGQKLNIPVSIIICARNEKETISHCLNSIFSQDYEKELIQIILVDDASNDGTPAQAETLLKYSGTRYILLRNASHLGKKASLIKAVNQAAHEMILFTDADTYSTSANWLKSMLAFQNTHDAALVIGPLGMVKGRGILWALQSIENSVLNLMACGSAHFNSAFLCSGANLLSTKTAFYKAGAYASHLHVASGDDIYFLRDLRALHEKVVFLKNREALVYTHSMPRFKALLAQKIRWAAKIKYNTGARPGYLLSACLAALSLACNLTWILVLAFSFMHPTVGKFVFLVFKPAFDLFLLFLSGRLIPLKGLYGYAPLISLIYPFYALCVGLGALMTKPKWK
ncbi:MAG TPA: glycosyltransferase [Bacteroidia bacterium]|nr:glycosyltransferase [Bacteroidia bacterium]